MSRARELLRDPMGPRRWSITGAAFLGVGALAHALHAPTRETSSAMMIVGALLALGGSAAELLLRARARGRDGPPRE